MKDSEYFKIQKLSFSKLSNFDSSGPKSLVSESNFDSEAFALGSLTEELIQGDKDSLNDNFIITDNIKPTASLGLLADEMLANNAELKLETAVTLSKMLGLWSSIKKDEVYRGKIDTIQFWEYLNIYKDKGDKKIVSPELLDLAQAMASGITKGKFTKDIFNISKAQELVYQVVIEWGDDRFKSKLDLIKLDHDLKTITPYDLKTSGFPTEDFVNSFYKYKYYLQAAMYTDALEEWRLDHYPDYIMKPFHFIVVSRDNVNTALLFKVSEGMINKGRDGFYNDDGKLTRNGYIRLADQVDWHIGNEKFDFSLSTYENKGNILIE